MAATCRYVQALALSLFDDIYSGLSADTCFYTEQRTCPQPATTFPILYCWIAWCTVANSHPPT